jgi:hypothetical protein
VIHKNFLPLGASSHLTQTLNKAMTAAQQYYESIGQSIAIAQQSQLFGKSCFKVHGKPFISFFEDCMVFKLSGDPQSMALALPGACLFDPSKKNRPMKAWVQVPAIHQEHWPVLAAQALELQLNN